MPQARGEALHFHLVTKKNGLYPVFQRGTAPAQGRMQTLNCRVGV